jgi:ATP-dependent RNA helicase DDX3X
MSGWGQVAAALPEAAPAVPPTADTGAVDAMNPQEGALAPNTQEAAAKNPQEHGWVAKTEYDYSMYMKSTKELMEAEAAAKASEQGVEVGGWASNAAIYEWDEDFGDVGPEHPELEKQLFGSENHVRVGIKFEA